MILKPLSDWMVLEEKVDEGSSIEIPDKFKESPGVVEGYIIKAIGEGWWEGEKYHPVVVKAGDTILIDAPGVARFEFKGIKYAAARARDVAFIVKEI